MGGLRLGGGTWRVYRTTVRATRSAAVLRPVRPRLAPSDRIPQQEFDLAIDATQVALNLAGAGPIALKSGRLPKGLVMLQICQLLNQSHVQSIFSPMQTYP